MPFKWLGLMHSSPASGRFWGLALGGVAVGAAAFGAWRGPAGVGLGLAAGLALGAGVFAAWTTRPGAQRPAAAPEPWRAMLLASVCAALMAHFIEINLGIAIVSTRIDFWLLAAALAAAGLFSPEAEPALGAIGLGGGPSRADRRGYGGRAAAGGD